MKANICALLSLVFTVFRTRLSLQFEVIALRHQLSVYQRTCSRPRINSGDRFLWSFLSRLWPNWKEHVVIVQPKTVIAWQRRRFRDYWVKLSCTGVPGRPAISKEVRDLIRQVSRANPGWGSPRIVGELSKLGIEVAKSTVDKYRVHTRKPSSPTWKAFLNNHIKDLVSIGFFVVPTVGFKVLYVLVVLSHHRRQIVHFNVTANPTAQWTAQQIVEAFPWDTSPKYLLRDRDCIYGDVFRKRIKSLGIEDIMTAPRSPWQNAFVERLIGSIRREYLDHVIVLNERHLKRVLASYFVYYHHWRTHLSLSMDCPDPRQVQPPSYGKVVQFPEVGGLHHHYERMAA